MSDVQVLAVLHTGEVAIVAVEGRAYSVSNQGGAAKVARLPGEPDEFGTVIP